MCGDPLPVRAVDIAALEMDGTVQVVVALERGGIWQRNVDGTWTIRTIERIRALVERDRPAPPHVTELDAPDPPTLPGESGTPQTPVPTCASPTQRTVTPNPLNGPPTTYEVCPDGR